MAFLNKGDTFQWKSDSDEGYGIALDTNRFFLLGKGGLGGKGAPKAYRKKYMYEGNTPAGMVPTKIMPNSEVAAVFSAIAFVCNLPK